MSSIKFKKIAKSETTPVDKLKRKEVFVRNAPICWNEDLEREIDATPSGKYYNRYEMDDTLDTDNWSVTNKIEVKLIGKPHVKLTLRVKGEPGFPPNLALAHALQPDDPRTISERAAAVPRVDKVVNRFISAVHKNWNMKYKIEISDPACGKKVLPVVFEVIRVEENHHFVILAHETYDREQVHDGKVYLSLDTDEHTHIHEFAHCIGLPDEYSYDEMDRQKIRYIKPDGIEDKIIVALAESESPTAADSSLMNSDNAFVFLVRHAWPVTIETQHTLRAATGRNITCQALLV